MDENGLKWLDMDGSGLKILEMSGHVYISDAAALVSEVPGSLACFILHIYFKDDYYSPEGFKLMAGL